MLEKNSTLIQAHTRKYTANFVNGALKQNCYMWETEITPLCPLHKSQLAE